MSRVIDASCENNVISIGAIEVEGSVLSEGVKASTGIAILEAEEVYYLTSSATDIKDLITSLVAIITQVETILTAIDAVTTTPGSSAALITSLTSLRSQLDLTKDNLK